MPYNEMSSEIMSNEIPAVVIDGPNKNGIKIVANIEKLTETTVDAFTLFNVVCHFINDIYCEIYYTDFTSIKIYKDENLIVTFNTETILFSRLYNMIKELLETK